MKIQRDYSYSKEEFLWMLHNKLGHHDLELTYNYTGKDGNKCYSKYIRYDYLQSIDYNQYIKPLRPFRITKKVFLRRCCHRTIHPAEILLDIDDTELTYLPPNTYKYPYFMFASIKQKTKWVLLELRKQGVIPVTCFTGSKSYHISVLHPSLLDLPLYERSALKQQVLWVYGADTQKNHDRAMIALEGEPHYKSGIPKQEVEL